MPTEVKEDSTLKEQDLVVWSAPARPFKRWDRQFYIKLISIVALVGAVLFLIEGFMPVILLVSLVFLFYVIFTTEPEIIQYKITNLGIRIGDTLTEWSSLT